jgi:hypothetical protein
MFWRRSHGEAQYERSGRRTVAQPGLKSRGASGETQSMEALPATDAHQPRVPLPTPSQATDPGSLDDEPFPRAVAGEDYDRYSRAMARDADLWVVAHLSRLSGAAIEPQELGDRLRSAAVVELGRPLNTQEERLLSEVVQRRLEAANPTEQIEPEIPSFLLKRMAS